MEEKPKKHERPNAYRPTTRRALVIMAVGLLFVGFGAPGFAQDDQTEFPLLRGPYLGQEPPGLEPVLFAPGVVSTDTAEWSTAFTPDGLELFFGLFAEGSTYILHMKSDRGRWTEPVVASFSGKYSDYDLTMSPNGNRVYFTSLRPASGTGPKIEDPDIWYVDRTEPGWGDPVRLPEPINTDGWELYPSESTDGFLYFFSSRPGGFGGFDIYRVSMEGDEFGQPANLGPAVNSERDETDSCISPNGDYIVFSSKRDEGFGDGDLYVSFKLAEHTWTKARNLGATVNTEHREFCPSVSRDGKYLFFTSRRPKNTKIPHYRNSARETLGLAPDPEQADIDIYWLDARYLDTLRVR